jgi:hemolysin III
VRRRVPAPGCIFHVCLKARKGSIGATIHGFYPAKLTEPDHHQRGHVRNKRSREEVANVATHGAGVLASLAGGSVLIVLAALRGSVWSVVGVSIFAGSLILLYSASTLYHASQNAISRRRLKVLDHSAIYVLIAGTYTPFLIGSLRGGWGWSLFGVIWGLALCGVVFKWFYTGRYARLSTGIYVAMGWLVMIAAGPLARAISPAALGWLVAGGLAYTGGTYFYHATRLKYAHAFWHLFVLGGSGCHAVAVALAI